LLFAPLSRLGLTIGIAMMEASGPEPRSFSVAGAEHAASLGGHSEGAVAGMDRHGIASRIRELIGDKDTDLASTAVRLGVAELSLRVSIDDLSPHPTTEVLVAIVRVFGVDPNWLIYGEYSPASHIEAAAVEETGGREALARLIDRLLDDRDLARRIVERRSPLSNLDRLET